MFSTSKKFSENLILLAFSSFLFMSLFGMGVSMEVKDGQMSSCPFVANTAAICQMSVVEHIGQWQHALLGIPTKTTSLIFALLLLALFAVPFVRQFSQNRESELTQRFISYIKNATSKIFDPLLLAFSDGILNPKIYEPARS